MKSSGQRRWGRITVGVVLMVGSAWVFASLYLGAGDRREVLAVARNVEASDTLERSDLRVVRVSVDLGVDTVPASHLDDIVGRPVGADLAAGQLLSEDQLARDRAGGLRAGEASVGMVLPAGGVPNDALHRSQAVRVVLRPPSGGEGELTTVTGRVLEWDDGEQGDVAIDVAVPDDDAARVSAGAADGRATIVAVAGST